MEPIIKHLEDELRKNNSNIEMLMGQYSVIEESSLDLITQKANIIGDTVQLKAKTCFIKKEIDIRRAYLEEIMKSHNTRISDGKLKKRTKITTYLSTIKDFVTKINYRKDIGLENISEEILYIIN